MANKQEVMKYFMPILMAELTMDDDFMKVLLRLNSSNDFIFILQAIKTRRNKILKLDGYFERVESLYNDEEFRSHFRLGKETVEVLVQLVGNCPEVPSLQQGPGRPPIPVESMSWFLYGILGIKIHIMRS